MIERNKIVKYVYHAVILAVLIALCNIIGFTFQKEYRYQLMNNVFVLDKQKGILYFLDGNYIKEVNYPEHKINIYKR